MDRPEDLIMNHPDLSESPVEAAEREFESALVAAAVSIVHVSQHSKNEKLRFEASRYIVERKLGKLTDKMPVEEMWKELFKDLDTKKDVPKE